MLQLGCSNFKWGEPERAPHLMMCTAFSACVCVGRGLAGNESNYTKQGGNESTKCTKFTFASWTIQRPKEVQPRVQETESGYGDQKKLS